MIEVVQGDGPIVLGLPHTGTDVPSAIRDRLNPRGLALADTDWHVDRLYAGLLEGATTVRTPVHRYVIDVNRAPDDASLYPGQNTTGLCPVTDFDGAPIWRNGQAPGPTEIEERRSLYHAPYHDALAAELQRVHDRHGVVLLYDCHSIRSRIPYLFEGQLPDFNIGTNRTTSCAANVQNELFRRCEAAPGYSSVLNGRFKGGWTTRHYGRLADGYHAIQMELAQRSYMEEAPPWRWDDAKARRLRSLLSDMLNALQALVLNGDLQ